MQLCFDATRFGFGLEEAIELAVMKKLPAVDFSFQPFAVSSKESRSLAAPESAYLKSIGAKAAEIPVCLPCLTLDYALDVEQKQAASRFQLMVNKLSRVAAALGCLRLAFSLEAGSGDAWLEKVVAAVEPALATCARADVKLLLRTGTPPVYRGVSLSGWQPLSPQSCREILAACPGLSLSFSPADCLWQGIDYLSILPALMPVVEHVEAFDVEVTRDLITDSGLFGPLWWRYRLPGRGQLDWRQLVEALKLYDYKGALSIRLDDEFVGSDPLELNFALDSCLSLLAPLAKG